MYNCCSEETAETLKSAKAYSYRLKNLMDKLDTAKQQICNTSTETERTIETIFTNLLTNLTNILNGRRDALIKKVQQLKLQSLAPLEECGADISVKIEKTDKFINEIESLLSGSIRNIDEFSQKSSSLASLPEIPELTEVPYISFHYSTNSECELLDVCSQFGEVSRIAPVQITETTEKPGGILVEWQNIEAEGGVDVQEFCLQRAFGDVTVDKHLIANFTNCFVGLETEFLVKELQPHQPYSFRVCCKYEGSREWSPWSLPNVAQTTIKPYCWACNEDFILANESSIAIPVKDMPSLLISDGPQFAVGYSIEFTYVNFDDKYSMIGLVESYSGNIKEIKSNNHNYFAVDSLGEIFVNGIKKSTKLPKVTKGVKICFTCELIHDNKVRVDVDSCDKRVTYDWNIDKSDRLYFAALLQSPASKLIVE